MSIINFLHISDSHVEERGKVEIADIVTKLCQDIKKVENENGITINNVCFSGDLIQSGSQAEKGEKQWDLAQEVLINPVIECLGLTKEDVIYAPGNHEVNTDNIKLVVEKGLNVQTNDEVRGLLEQFDSSYVERLSHFYSFIRANYSEVQVENLGYSLIKKINGLTVGFACVDSAWRSSGKGYTEKGKLYVGLEQVKKLLSNIEEADLKVCIMHHPVDWLIDEESNLIARELAKFDLVLNGHVHESDTKQMIRSAFNTVYSTAGKLYPLDYQNGRVADGYNSYSIISYDTDRKYCKIFARSYYGMNRGCFDAGVNICPNGETEFYIRSDDDGVDVEVGLVNGIRDYLQEMSEKFSFLKTVDKTIPERLENVIVEPTLSRDSEYVREKADEPKSSEISIDQIIAESGNQLIVGKRETGKTTILQNIGLKILEEYGSINTIPLFVDMQKLAKGKDRIFKAAFQFAINSITSDVSITKDMFVRMAEEGRFNILIDNVDVKNANHCKWIQDFMNNHPQIRCFVTAEEEFFHVLDVRQMPEVFEEYNISYIKYLGRNQIRQLVTNWSNADAVDIDDVVRKIDTYCNNINFAKTPFNISIFMVIWNHDMSYVPENEGILMQNYLMIVLEKLSPNEARRENYSFDIKEDFLSCLAYEMYRKGTYALTYEDFISFTTEYHQRKGYRLKDSKFDSLFFEKNVLACYENSVAFSRTSFLDFFLAVYAVNNETFLEEILFNGNIILFRNTICFYAGLKKDCETLLDRLSDRILGTIVENIDLIDELNNIEFVTEFKVDKDEMLKNIEANRLSIEEADSLSDETHKYDERKPSELARKSDTTGDTADNYYVVLDVYAGVIKNAELLDNSLKIRHLENYMYGMNMLYAMMIKMMEVIEFDQDYGELTEEQKERYKITTKEEFITIQNKLLDMIKLVFPVALQHLILESVGTPKLRAAAEELIKAKDNCPFEKFMLMFLKTDLRVGNYKEELVKYVRNETSISMLKLIYIKLRFYYQTGVFGRDERTDQLLVELITDVYMRIHPMKRQIKKNLRIQKSMITKSIKETLDKQIVDID